MDVLILGGGVIGLSLAIELKLRGCAVQVLDTARTGMATRAAAGMLAPEAEGLAPGPLRTLALQSRELWPAWSEKLAYLSQQAEIGYWPSGILSPRPVRPQGIDGWNRAQVEQILPQLDPQFTGAAWFPRDAQVDPRRLLTVLMLVCGQLGVPIHPVQVEQLIIQDGQIHALKTDQGNWSADQYVLCTGSWAAALLGLPIFPLKGQMMALQMPRHRLSVVVFGPGIYLVPRREGKLIVGATEEDVGFTPETTPIGLQSLRTRLGQLLPEALDWPILETWYGYRPTTPDHSPILGLGPYPNLQLALGHHRNGILLSPQTARLLADSLTRRPTPQLEPFSYQRFKTPAQPEN
ncbi:glycine oxidase ThiO [Candidatus Cyanaurora vandensis]|uniref:glycine oxidase ThiO n=1 Tax=Candidatus Cyanaurora vandensis TaxID=2714958 RepID=UPI00257E7DF0|nr:glycine oxidase ThiO [Candidatus Cyanaurora vandensis]